MTAAAASFMLPLSMPFTSKVPCHFSIVRAPRTLVLLHVASSLSAVLRYHLFGGGAPLSAIWINREDNSVVHEVVVAGFFVVCALLKKHHCKVRGSTLILLFFDAIFYSFLSHFKLLPKSLITRFVERLVYVLEFLAHFV